MSMLSNLDLIRRVPLFSMLSNEHAQQVADSVVKRRFRRGELVTLKEYLDTERVTDVLCGGQRPD